MKPHHWSKQTDSRRTAATTLKEITATPMIFHSCVPREEDDVEDGCGVIVGGGGAVVVWVLEKGAAVGSGGMLPIIEYDVGEVLEAVWEWAETSLEPVFVACSTPVSSPGSIIVSLGLMGCSRGEGRSVECTTWVSGIGAGSSPPKTSFKPLPWAGRIAASVP